MTDLAILIGTMKGLFIGRTDERREKLVLDGPHLVGQEIYAAALDQRDGRRRLLVGACSSHWGPGVAWSDDLGRTWTDSPDGSIAFPEDIDASLARVWQLTPAGPDQPDVVWAGAEPASLWRSDDRGETFGLVRGLWDHPHRPQWEPGGGGLCLHTILVDDQDPQNMWIAVSSAGLYRTTDGGQTWEAANTGIKTPFLPADPDTGFEVDGMVAGPDAPAPAPEFGQCVHKAIRHPGAPDRLMLQHHWGIYRSDDRGTTWQNVGSSIPSAAEEGYELSPFGFPIVAHPRDPDTAWVLPLGSEMQRWTVDGRCRVYRTRDAGGTWEALTNGLPQEHAYLTILRDGFCADSLDPAGLWFGTRTGELFSSSDEGDSWRLTTQHLPPIVCVKAATLP